MKRPDVAMGGVYAAVLAAGLGLGVVVTLAFVAPPVPGILRPSDAAPTVPVTLQEFDDPHPVEVAVGVSPANPVVVPRSGTVTGWSCAAGATLESGEAVVTVDGTRLVGLATAVPIWRDLEVGMSGDDVTALQDELARLGYKPHRDGVFSFADVDALGALARHAQTRSGDGFARDAYVWIPASTAVVEECAVGLGATVTTGQTLATAAGDVTVASVALPENRVPGERVLNGFDEPIVLGEGGEIPADVSSAMVRRSPAFREAAGGVTPAAEVTVPALVVLADPVEVGAVPATSVLSDGGRSCVLSGSQSFGVTVVGSEFGDAFVLFADEDPPATVLASVPEGRRSCR